MEQRQILAGTKLYFGAPAQPMHQSRSAAIAAAVARVPGIVEAHLPQCFIEGDAKAQQVLVVVVSKRAEIARIMGDLNLALRDIIPGGLIIDILPFSESTVAPGVREAHCQILPAVIGGGGSSGDGVITGLVLSCMFVSRKLPHVTGRNGSEALVGNPRFILRPRPLMDTLIRTWHNYSAIRAVVTTRDAASGSARHKAECHAA